MGGNNGQIPIFTLREFTFLSRAIHTEDEGLIWGFNLNFWKMTLAKLGPHLTSKHFPISVGKEYQLFCPCYAPSQSFLKHDTSQ